MARVEGRTLRVLGGFPFVYALAGVAIESGVRLAGIVRDAPLQLDMEYEPIYRGLSEWRLLPPIDHPVEPANCHLTGTGSTHRRSAAAQGETGVTPEWFYKGNGNSLRAHNDALEIPPFALDGGEEGEVAALYLIAEDGQPRRLGFAIGNEFSDHKLERRNYLYLAHSKLRDCAIGPELCITDSFEDLRGGVRIERNGALLWSTAIAAGQRNTTHSLANLEHHHIKYPLHRRPGDVHIHFLGADALSVSAGVELQDGDVMEIAFEDLGRPLRNTIRRVEVPEKLVRVQPL